MMALFKHKEAWLLLAVFSLFGILYISQLTASGLWFDESIEYYYSKFMVGEVPVNPVDQSGSNMYERICITYQPPLYNILMYLWLCIFDSESWFRLAGVITTFIGAVGFYCSLRRLSGYAWAIGGLCFYLSTAAIVFFALECSEYNLMICMESWMLYFYVVCAQSTDEPVNWRAVTCFFLFAALSVYSQYGAAFFVVALFVSLCFVFFKAKRFSSIYRLVLMGVVTLVVAIVPLLYFFLRVQMEGQGTVQVDHSPVFVGSLLGGVPYSLIKSFFEQVKWIFSTSINWGYMSAVSMWVIAFIVFACTIVVAFLKNRLPVLRSAILACTVCYLLFFILSACSYYAYNSWDGKLGCNNIIEHTRYVLFIVPLLVFMMAIGMISFCKALLNRGYLKGVIALSASLLLVYFAGTVWGLYIGKIKSDGREVTEAWIERHDFQHAVVVQEWLAGIFMFYYQHSDVCRDDISKNIILTKQDMRMPEKTESHLRELGVFELPSFYFIGSKSAIGMKNDEGIQIIRDLFTKKGYKVETIWKKTGPVAKGRGWNSELLFISK